jgi:hypothetical protein
MTKSYANDGNGFFTEIHGLPFDSVTKSSIAFVDVDGDNDDDLFISGESFSGNPVSKLYLNDGMGMFSELTGTPFEPVKSGSIAFSDIDQDNDQDLLITGFNGTEYVAKLYSNDGNGNFTELLGIPLGQVNNYGERIILANKKSIGNRIIK